MSSAPFLPFALPDIGDDEIAEVVDTLRSGWVTTGPKAMRFEKAFGEFLGDEPVTMIFGAMRDKAIDEILVGKAFGGAGAKIVIQEFLEGIEVSLHALCDGTTAKIFPTSQDHKRALDNDEGLNTGGMGTYSPTPFLNDTQLAETARRVLEPFMRGFITRAACFMP